jgi:hypothetical protein
LSTGQVVISGFNLVPPDPQDIILWKRILFSATGNDDKSANPPSVRVSLDSVPCSDINFLDNVDGSIGSRLSVNIHPGEGCDKELLIDICGLVGRLKFSFLAPVILKTESIPTNGGDMVITGEGFGSDFSCINVYIRGVRSIQEVFLSIKHKVIQVKIPPGVGTITKHIFYLSYFA